MVPYELKLEKVTVKKDWNLKTRKAKLLPYFYLIRMLHKEISDSMGI